MTSSKISKILIHLYMIVTIVSTLVLSQGFTSYFLEIGASSWFIAIAVSGAAGSVNVLIGAFLWLWGITFPILLVIFYIMACKNNHTPFIIICAMDAVIVMVCTILWYFTDNTFSFNACISDAVVSTIYAAIMIISMIVPIHFRAAKLDDVEKEQVN